MSIMKAPPNQAAQVFVTTTQMGQPVRTAQQGTSSGLLAGAAPTLPAWASLPHTAHTRHRYSFLWGVRANWPRVTSGPPGGCPEPMRAAAQCPSSTCMAAPAMRVAGLLSGPAGLCVLLPSVLCPPASCLGLGAVSSGPNGREFPGGGWDHRRWQEVWFLKKMRSWFAGRRVGEWPLGAPPSGALSGATSRAGTSPSLKGPSLSPAHPEHLHLLSVSLGNSL